MNFPKHLLPEWEGRVILGGRCGSKAWGTDTPDSDDDWFAVWAHPPRYYYSLAGGPDSPRRYREEDHHARDGLTDLNVYDARKFVLHLSRNLPEFHKLCWISPAYRSHMSRGGRVIHDNRFTMVDQRLVTAFWESGRNMFLHGLVGRALFNLTAGRQLAKTGQLDKMSTNVRQAILDAKAGDPLYAEEMCGMLLSGPAPYVLPPNPRPGWKWYNELMEFIIDEEERGYG